jgi:diguanylate cyclase (GGDEF)-like protein
MATVYRAHDRESDRVVAIKVMAPALRGDLEAQRRFKAEHRVMAALDHPGVPRVHSQGLTADGLPFFAMELVEGEPLQRPGQLPPDTVRALLAELLPVLDHLHRRGLVHGDLKAGNLMQSPEGRLKLMDFGLAGPAGARPHGVEGTVTHLAPELIQRGKADQRSDLYALGVTTFRWLTGRLPLEGPTPGDTLRMHLEVPPPSPRRLAPEVDADLDAAVMRLLAKRPQDRFQSANEVARALGLPHADHDELAMPLLPPFVGRKALLGDLLGHANQAAQGHPTRPLLLFGAPGVGKTRLLEELSAQARLMDLAMIAAHCPRDPVPYGPWLDLGRDLVAVGQRRSPESADALQLALEPFTSRRAAGPDAPQALRSALTRLLGALAESGGLVVTLDDWHRADPASQALLAHLVREGARWPIAWIAAASEPLTEFPGHELTLAPLTAVEVAELVAAHLGAAEAPAPAVEQVHRATGGNPRFVEDLLRYMLAHGQLKRRQAGWELVAGAAGTLPDGIQALYAANWAELDAAQRALLTVLAVAACPLGVGLAADAAGIGPDAAEAALAALSARQWLEEETLGVALHDAAFGAWIRDRHGAAALTRLHQALADRLAARLGDRPPLALVGALAHHAMAGERPSDALPWLLAAARESLVIKAFPECRRFARAALDLGTGPDPEARLELLDLLASAHRGMDEPELARALAEEAVALSTALGRADLLARTLNGLGKIHQLASRYDDAKDAFERAAAAAGDETPLELARAHRSLARLAFFAGDAESTYRHGREALALVRRHAGAAERAEVLAEIGEMFQGGEERVHEGLNCLEEAQSIARELDDPHLESTAAAGLGNLQLALGQLAAARVSFARAATLFEKLGNAGEATFARLNLALVAEDQGRFPEASRLASKVAAEARAANRKFPLAVALAIEGAALVHVGSPGEGLRLLAEGAGIAEEINHKYARAIVRQLEAPVRVLLGQWTEARAEAEALSAFGRSAGAPELAARADLLEAEIRLETGAPHDVEPFVGPHAPAMHAGVRLRTHLLRARAAMAMGQGPAAYQALAMAGNLLTELDAPRQEAELLMLEAELADAHGEDGAPLAAAAVKLLEESAQRHQLVRALALTARLGPTKTRKAALDRARELASAMAASLGPDSGRYLAAFGREALGHEPEPAPSAGVPTTMAELRELAARLEKGLARVEAGAVDPADALHTRRRLDQVVGFAQAVNSTLDVELVVDRALSLIIEVTGAERGLLLLKEARNLTRARYATAPGFEDDGHSEQYSRSVARTVLETGETVCVMDALSDPRFGQQASVLGLNLQTIICVPLKDQAEVLGAIYVDRQELADGFARSDLEAVQALASLAAQAIINARLMRAQEERRSQLEMLNRLHRTVARTLELDQVLDAIAQMTIEFTKAERAILLLADGETLSFGGGRDKDGPLPATASRELSRSVCQKVLETQQAVYVFDAGADHEFAARMSVINLKLGSVLGVPLMGQSGLIGILYVDSRSRAASALEKELELLTAVANVAALAVENARLYHLATVDGLTGLYVRSFFNVRLEEEVKRVRRYGGKFSLLVMDIDHFKKFNDTYGHQTGDEVIKLVARTLKDCIRIGIDVPGRFGGEELVVFLPETDAVGATVVAERIRERIEHASLTGPAGEVLKVTISLGVATFPEMGDTAVGLFDHADQALYTSKRAGRNRWTLYEAEAESTVPAAEPTQTTEAGTP